MRLGGPIFDQVDNPTAWAQAHQRLGYSAALLPIEEPEDPRLADYIAASQKAGLLIAEVGAWSNPISADEVQRTKALDLCCRRLELAERAGAWCCVNIAGSRGSQWDGPHPDNLTGETFDLIVQSVRQILDAVKPRRTFYTLEAMPWVYPDSPESYLALIQAIERPQFGVHLDPVNMINCPQRMYRTGDFIRTCFEKLGPHIRSCHAKDIQYQSRLTLHLEECRPGTGVLDYRTYLGELFQLGPDVPLMLEHLPNAEEYAAAARYIRQMAHQIGGTIR